MIITYTIVGPLGEVFGWGTVQQELLDTIQIPQGCSLVKKDCIFRENAYWDGQDFIPFPPKPERYVKFDYTSKAWVRDPDAADLAAKEKRNRLLTSSDWTDTASAPGRLGEALYTAWQAYRQALRDVPQQSGYPFDIEWPTPPA